MNAFNRLAIQLFDKISAERNQPTGTSTLSNPGTVPTEQFPGDAQEQIPDTKNVNLVENPVSPQSINHENYDAVDNELENNSNPTSPASPDSAPETQDFPTQHSIPDLSATFNSTCPDSPALTQNDGSTQHSTRSLLTQVTSTQNDAANETFSNIPERPVIHPRIIPPEDQPKKLAEVKMLQIDDSLQTDDPFYDDLPGIESPLPEPEDKYAQFKKYHEADDPIAAFCKAKGINFTKCTPREYYGGSFKTDKQFRKKNDEIKAAKGLSEYKEGDSIWKKREINGSVYMQLKNSGYACNSQEMNELKLFMEAISENLTELGLMKSEGNQAGQEKIEKRIRSQFDFQKRNMNDRFDNLANLEVWKNEIAQKFGIDFDDDLTQA